jgi:tetratricopeptide (TPR) repeat protein
MARSPESEWPHRLASIALRRRGDHTEALWHAREAVRLEPDGWRCSVNLVHTLGDRRTHRAEARSAAERALELAPHEVDAHMVVGSVAAAQGRAAEAEAAYRNALALDPQCSAAHNELARLKLRKTGFLRPSSLAEAATGFATAVRADPRSSTSRRNLESVLRTFVARVAYLIFLDAWFVARPTSSADRRGVLILAVVALAIPAAFAARFVSSATPTVRRHLLAIVLRDSRITPTVICELLAITALVAAAAAPTGAQATCALVAAGLSLLGRLILWAQSGRRSGADRRVE